MLGGIPGVAHDMIDTRFTHAIVFIALLTTAVLAVSAAEPGGTTIISNLSLGSLPDTPPSTINVSAGNITQVSLSVQQSTFRWVGLLGNVTGSIILGDSTSETFYTWSARGNLVYAATSPSVLWANLSDANNTEVIGVAAYLGGGANDAYNNTFIDSPENIGSQLFTISSDYALTDSANATSWKTYSLWDDTTLVWAGKVVENGTSYRNTTVDYQMIIPEDGTGGDTTPTTYYLWVENI